MKNMDQRAHIRFKNWILSQPGKMAELEMLAKQYNLDEIDFRNLCNNLYIWLKKRQNQIAVQKRTGWFRFVKSAIIRQSRR